MENVGSNQKTYSLTLANLSDTDEVLRYLKTQWRSDHIFVNNKKLFQYEFADKENLNFVLAKDQWRNIVGLIGFIKSSNRVVPDIWPSFWKVSQNLKDPILGIKLLNYMRKHVPHRGLIGSSIHPSHMELFKYLGFNVSFLKHYYLMNKEIRHYKVATCKVDNTLKYDFLVDKSVALVRLDSLDELSSFDFSKYCNIVPFKDFQYLKKRYVDYPIFNYEIYKIEKNKVISSLIVLRKIKIRNTSVLRIVDFIGDESILQYIARYLYAIVLECKCEYIDFLCFGFSRKILGMAQFMEIDYDSCDIVIPNHFQPLIEDNVKINFYSDVPEGIKYRICKADGDQDRPN